MIAHLELALKYVLRAFSTQIGLVQIRGWDVRPKMSLANKYNI